MDKVDSIQEQMSNVGRQVKILEGPRRNAAAAAAAAAGSLQSCPTLSDPMDCSLPGSATHGIFQARVLEWAAIAFSKIVPSYKYQRFFKQLNNLNTH